jgi:hypothetical protein
MNLDAQGLVSGMVGLLLMMSGYLSWLARFPKTGVMFSMADCQWKRHDKMRAHHDRQFFKPVV